jgi:hypothetical protein
MANEPQLTGPWRKSSYSDQGACVELAPTTDGVGLRNSNDHTQGTLYFTRAEFEAWIKGCKAGEFDGVS